LGTLSGERTVVQRRDPSSDGGSIQAAGTAGGAANGGFCGVCMSENRLEVLFLGHSAARTGAPLLLLELVRWLAAARRITPRVALLTGGPLESEYSSVAHTRCAPQSRVGTIAKRLGIPIVTRPRLPPEVFLGGRSVVYANTVACARALTAFAGKGKPIIHHIHELEAATSRLGMIDAMRANVSITDLYIAASEAVAEFLRTAIAVPPDRIRVIHEFAINLPCSANRHIHREKIRALLGLNTEHILVLMCGTPEVRKGTDLFIRIASVARASRDGGRLRFLWLGGSAEKQKDYVQLCRNAGVEAICRFQTSMERPQEWVAAADIFCLTSREDPFSVAMLEAAMHAMPIVCFAGAGGGPEMVEDDAGFVVAKEDVQAMATACIRLSNDEALRTQLGDAAKTKVQQRYLIHHQAPRIQQEILRLGER